jgi:hypothetical protein
MLQLSFLHFSCSDSLEEKEWGLDNNSENDPEIKITLCQVVESASFHTAYKETRMEGTSQ